MRKKITITIFIIITILNLINPIKVNAFEEKREIISTSAKIEKYKAEDIVSETTGLDTITGLILEPAVEFFTFIIDSIMGVFTSVMTQNSYEHVMIENLDKLPDLGEVGATYTITDMAPYKNALGNMDLKYPNFSYSPEEIFSGNLDMLDINFIDDSNNDSNWLKIRNVIGSWYKILRMIAIIGLLSVLIYTGIKIIISSNTKDKAKYKELLINWIIGVVLVFSLHYIMAFILNVIEEIMGLLKGLTGVIEVDAGGTKFKTNLIGLARFQLQQMHFSAKITYLVIYTALVVFTFKFTFLYLKRVLNMAFLTVISPIVALTYPLDKMDGNAKGFEMWIKEFIYNALLQPLHYILYYILVTSSLTLASKNLIYAIAALMFISEAERLLKRIFGFDKATGGTVGGYAGAFATGAITGALTKFVKNPLGIGKGNSSKGSSGGTGNSDGDSDEDLPNDFIDDTGWENFFGIDIGGGIPVIVQAGSQEGTIAAEDNQELTLQGPTIPGISDWISRYRAGLPLSIKELGGLSFDDDTRSIEELLKQIAEYQRILRNSIDLSDEDRLQLENNINELESMLQWRVMSNENAFSMDGRIPLQYIDGDGRSSSELMDEILRLNELSNNVFLPSNERRSFRRQSEKLLKTLNRRMAQNQHIERQGGVQTLMQQERNRINGETSQPEVQTRVVEQNVNQERQKLEKPKVVRGIENVAKTITKPVWDTEKDVGYNGKRLVGKAVRGVAGVTLGVAVAAVQAGISITDGKYNPMEGVATVGAGIIGSSKIGQNAGSLKQAYKDAVNQGEDGKSLEEYSKQWFNRDDVISQYNKEFPGQGKEMRRRAVNNYVSRGITDIKEQKQALKFAELLKKERGMEEEEADKLAIATLQYKRNLTQNSNYTILFDQEKRDKYLDVMVDSYVGAASKKSVRKLHSDFIENVRAFDRANR